MSNPGKTIKRKLRSDTVIVKLKTRETELKAKVVDYLNRGDKSVVVRDRKKRVLRYRLSSLKDLHDKMLVDENVDCSYSQFTLHCPQYIMKPNPEDCGKV